MSRYLDNIREDFKEYFSILSKDIPDWLYDYIETKELLKQQYISTTCGIIYTDLFSAKELNIFYSSLDHSIAVALIVWNFTHDKTQTLAGLFHDIATPCFKHCVDFLNGDYMNQESTEDLTKEIIENSKEIMSLLNKDNIKIEDVCNYHIYPICDNETPKLSADRLEYTLSNALFVHKTLSIEEVKEIYNDLEIQTNEEGIIEIGFKTKKIARNLVKLTSKLSIIYRDERTRYSMQFIADLIKRLVQDELITINDLYNKKESEIIKIIEESKYKEIFEIWKNSKKIKISKEEPKDVYFVHHPSKVRYIDPLFNGLRMSKACKIANKMIEKNLSYDMSNYIYLDFEFVD